ncbi:unnamed protein product, partial [Oikopleura dioica]
AMLNEKNVMQRTGIRSCNDEKFAMIWTLCENEINFMCQNEYSEGVNGQLRILYQKESNKVICYNKT